MNIASEPLPGAVAVEEHNDVDHTSLYPSPSLDRFILALRPKDNETHPTQWLRWFAASVSPTDQWALPGAPQTDPIPGGGDRLYPEACHQPGADYLEQLYAFGDVLRAPRRARARPPERFPVPPRRRPRARGVRGVLGVDSATEVTRTLVHENIRWFPVDELPETRL